MFKCQFGFREKHSTAMALMVLTDNILTAIDQGNYYLGVFLDFSKAFDTVNHGILLSKLQRYGIRGIAYNWVKNYLSQRVQYVSFNNFRSNNQMISCGVPQGSILGPLLFLLYINDLPQASSVLTSILFADDSSLFMKGDNIDVMKDILNEELNHVKSWVDANKLSLNIDKTCYMVFSTSRKKVDKELVIRLDGKIIKRVDSTKFSGVIIDANLSWKQHIIHVKSKISKGLGVICKARKYFDKSVLINLYYSFIYPYLSYGIEVWGNVCKTSMLSLFRLQKKIIRVIASKPFREHTAPLFSSLKILTVSKLHHFRIGLFMFNVSKKTCPSVIGTMFMSSNTHQHNTRYKDSYLIPSFKTSFAQTSIRYVGTNIWNKLSKLIDHKSSIHTYKFRLKSLLIKQDIV